jgi:carbonic anhydrase
VAGTSELATIEYGLGHLHSPLLVVLGHTKCGAVTAVATGAELHGHLEQLAEQIKPAAVKARAQTTNATEVVAKAIEANIWGTIETILRESPEVRELVAGGRVQIVGALYHLDTGVVSWMGPHPELKRLLADDLPVAQVDDRESQVVPVGVARKAHEDAKDRMQAVPAQPPGHPSH